MHSFHPSRGKVLFEVLCALAISASLAGAWMQTGASALLAAAAVAAFYGLGHLFDLKRPKSVVRVEPQRIDFAADGQAELVAGDDAGVPSAEPQPEPEKVVEELELVEPAAPPAKAPRKSRARRAKTPKQETVTELAVAEEPEAAEPAATEEPEVAELAVTEEEEVPAPWPVEEGSHPHIAPLFEPDPFGRMQRRAFGKRGRL